MKKTAVTLMLLAGLGGCASTDKSSMTSKFNATRNGSEVPGFMGPDGTPVMQTKQAVAATKQALTKSKSGAIQQASATMPVDPMVQQMGGFSRIVGHGGGCNDCNAHIPGGHGGHLGGHFQGGGSVDPYAYGPMESGLQQRLGFGGVLPPTAMGPYGAVAATGAIGAGPGGGMGGPAFSNQRTAVKFVGPEKMRLSWLVGGNYVDSGMIAPASYNFMQGNIYRLKLSGVPTQASRTYYPTLEVAPATLKTITYLSHNSVPVSFTNDDLERVNAGNMVVKVIYLPDPAFQDSAALGGAEEVVSTQLEPGADPVQEAMRRGTILAVIRLGNINLENPNSPAMDAMGGMPGAGMPGPAVMSGPPGMMPPPDVAGGRPTSRTVPAIPTSRPSNSPSALPAIPQVR